MNALTFTRLASLIVAIVIAGPTVPADEPANLSALRLKGRVSVKIGDQRFAEYAMYGFAKPIVHPIYGPGQVLMTRNFPVWKQGKAVEGEPTDHLHHKSLWLGHGNVNGEDFWTEKGRIVHDRIEKIDNNPKSVVITAASRWVNRRDKIVCTDTTRVGFVTLPGGARAIDYDVTIHASHGPVTFGDTKEGFMAVRITPALQLKADPKQTIVARGQAVNSRGDTGKDVWGRRADWVDYFGPIDGQTMGLAMLDHPQNPRHPTYWHARDYGLVAANPFGVSDFTGKKESGGAMTIPAGKDQRFRYRIVLHRGDAEQAKMAKLYEEYSKQ